MNYQNHIEQIVDDLYNINRPVVLTRPKPEFGDYSTTIALELSKELKASAANCRELLESSIQIPAFTTLRLQGLVLLIFA